MEGEERGGKRMGGNASEWKEHMGGDGERSGRGLEEWGMYLIIRHIHK